MARAHFVKKARKDYPDAGISKGDSYYWWQFRHGPKRMQKTPPRPSQLTSSPYYGPCYEAQEVVEHAPYPTSDMALEEMLEFVASFEEAKGMIEGIMEECEEKKSNMEEHFPNGCPVMEQLEERHNACENLVSELEDAHQTGEDLVNEYQTLCTREDDLRERLDALTPDDDCGEGEEWKRDLEEIEGEQERIIGELEDLAGRIDWTFE